MTWKSYLYPQVIARYSSKYNRDIRVVETFGKLKLLVNGSPQSGPYIASLWKSVFRFIPQSAGTISSILVLGIGGGTAIRLLRQQYPHSRITGVDIDRMMIEIGKKYFDLDGIPPLSLITTDADVFVTNILKRGNHFDLVVVDVFIGPVIPDFVQSTGFLIRLKKVTSPEGIIVINYLREKEYREKSNILLDKLREIFHSVIESNIFLNRFFICTN